MRARDRVMGEIEEVRERMKADMQALKVQIATMMKVMNSMKKIVEVNTTVVAEVEPTPPFGLNQINHSTLDMVGQGGNELGSMDNPHVVQIQNKHTFLPYGLPPNYTPPNVAHIPALAPPLFLPLLYL